MLTFEINILIVFAWFELIKFKYQIMAGEANKVVFCFVRFGDIIDITSMLIYFMIFYMINSNS